VRSCIENAGVVLRAKKGETMGKRGQVARRGSYRVVFGEGERRWSLGDPGHPLVSQADWQARHEPLNTSSSQVLILASIVSDMHYLVHVCPSTKLACEKLAAIRAAVRKLGPVESDQ
jgi:hypothetical protein